MSASAPPASEPAVLFEREGAIAILTLNRPDNRNSMTPELLDGFAARVAEVRALPDVRCVVLAARGNSFSAGADFRSQIQREDTGAGLTPAERSFAMYTAFLSLLEVEVPVVAALSGHAVGGGFGLALVCDIRVASETAKYGANFTRLGLHPGMAISYLLPRLVGVPRAAELLFTGRLFDGREGAGMGLFSRAVAPAEVLPAAMALARDIAANAPIAVRLTKRSLYKGLQWDVRGAAWQEAFAQAATVDSADAREGIEALLAKRSPVFSGR